MTIRQIESNKTIIVVSGDQARIVVGLPTRVISVDGLTDVDIMALNNFDGCSIDSGDYMGLFEAAFLNRLLSWATPDEYVLPVSKDQLREYVVAYFRTEDEARDQARMYLEQLDLQVDPNQSVIDNAVNRLIDCYTDFEGWAVKQDDGSITLTKGGRAIREAKWGSDQIVEIK